ncbi:hypothetical protein ACWD3J_24300 [Streptomyces sp. NPDC002755]
MLVEPGLVVEISDDLARDSAAASAHHVWLRYVRDDLAPGDS